MQRGSKFTDYYELLGIEPRADTIQIRRAYIEKAKRQHPDVGGSTEVMRTLNIAYRTLTSSTSKTAYDMLHSFNTGTKEVVYKEVGYAKGSEPSADYMSDEYIDWFLDSVYEEYSNISKPELTLKKLVKKVFNIN